MTTYRLMDGVSGRPGNGPSTGTSYSGDYVAGAMFSVTSGGMWFEGYWWWVAASGQDTASGQKFALWQVNAFSGAVLVPGSTVTAGALTAGAWNYVPLATPLLLAPAGFQSYGGLYCAATGYVASQGIPITKNQFGTGDPYVAGITNGPLSCPSSLGTSDQAGQSFGGWSRYQMPFSTSGSDPSVTFPTVNDADDNLWLDVQVSDTAPAGSQNYRAFPNMPVFVAQLSATGTAYTLGLEFTLSKACTLQKIWHYSPSGATVLPTRCGIWDVASQTEVAGTDNSSPSWKVAGGGAASAGAGWIYCDYSGSGVTLNASQNYKVSTFTSDNTDAWFQPQVDVWGGSPGPFSSGITQGPLQVLGNAAASPGQASWHQSTTWAYPDTTAVSEYDGIDVEVTPVSGTSHTATASLVVTPSFSAARTRGHYRTASLTVTPAFTAARTRGKYRTGALTVTPSFSAARQRGKYRTGSLTVVPSFDAARARGHYRTGALEVIPVFAAVRIRGHYRSAALMVTPSFSAIPSGGAFAPPVFIYPAYWTAAWAQADTRVTVSPAGAQTATVTSAVLGESAATLYPPGPAVIYPSP